MMDQPSETTTSFPHESEPTKIPEVIIRASHILDITAVMARLREQPEWESQVQSLENSIVNALLEFQIQGGFQQAGIAKASEELYSPDEIRQQYAHLLLKKSSHDKPQPDSVWQVSPADSAWQKLAVKISSPVLTEILANSQPDLLETRQTIVNMLRGELGNSASAFSAPIELLRQIKTLRDSGEEKEESIHDVLAKMTTNLELATGLPQLLGAIQYIVEHVYWPVTPQSVRKQILETGKSSVLPKILASENEATKSKYGLTNEKTLQYAWIIDMLCQVKRVTNELRDMQEQEPFRKLLTISNSQGEVVIAGQQNLAALQFPALQAAD